MIADCFFLLKMMDSISFLPHELGLLNHEFGKFGNENKSQFALLIPDLLNTTSSHAHHHWSKRDVERNVHSRRRPNN